MAALTKLNKETVEKACSCLEAVVEPSGDLFE